MVLGQRGDLGQVGHTKHLVPPRQAGQFRADRAPDFAAHIRIDFVEDQQGRGVGLGQNRLEREHDPGGLPARRDFVERQQILPGIGREEKAAVAVPPLM